MGKVFSKDNNNEIDNINIEDLIFDEINEYDDIYSAILKKYKNDPETKKEAKLAKKTKKNAKNEKSEKNATNNINNQHKNVLKYVHQKIDENLQKYKTILGEIPKAEEPEEKGEGKFYKIAWRYILKIPTINFPSIPSLKFPDKPNFDFFKQHIEKIQLKLKSLKNKPVGNSKNKSIENANKIIKKDTEHKSPLAILFEISNDVNISFNEYTPYILQITRELCNIIIEDDEKSEGLPPANGSYYRNEYKIDRTISFTPISSQNDILPRVEYIYKIVNNFLSDIRVHEIFDSKKLYKEHQKGMDELNKYINQFYKMIINNNDTLNIRVTENIIDKIYIIDKFIEDYDKIISYNNPKKANKEDDGKHSDKYRHSKGGGSSKKVGNDKEGDLFIFKLLSIILDTVEYIYIMASIMNYLCNKIIVNLKIGNKINDNIIREIGIISEEFWYIYFIIIKYGEDDNLIVNDDFVFLSRYPEITYNSIMYKLSKIYTFFRYIYTYSSDEIRDIINKSKNNIIDNLKPQYGYNIIGPSNNTFTRFEYK